MTYLLKTKTLKITSLKVISNKNHGITKVILNHDIESNDHK